ncbi:hypothetical protein QQ045_000926 [Rhodiola kirilowii]
MLDSEADVNKALTFPFQKVGHTYFKLFRWAADYNPKQESTRITKWIRLPGLPMEFFAPSCLRAIVSSFAHYLGIDERTRERSALNYARACVEFDVNKPLPSRVWINLPCEKGFYQEVLVEGNIRYCSRCKLLTRLRTRILDSWRWEG